MTERDVFRLPGICETRLPRKTQGKRPMRTPSLRAALICGGLLLAGGASLPAFAMGDWPKEPGKGRPGKVTQVPEIDAGAGLGAMAAVAAILALAWERRRG